MNRDRLICGPERLCINQVMTCGMGDWLMNVAVQLKMTRGWGGLIWCQK